MKLYFFCDRCKHWLEERACPKDPAHNPNLRGMLLDAEPDNLVRSSSGAATHERKLKPDTVPYKPNVGYGQQTRFGLKIKLKGTEEQSAANFWFSYDGKLYEAICREMRTTLPFAVVDGLCWGKHGGHKTHVRTETAARNVLTGAGYIVNTA